MPPYDVAISPEMVSRLEDCLQQLNISPVNLQTAPMGENKEINLLLPSEDIKPDPNRIPQMSSVISWSPPQQNWNPWNACNIDEGYLATADLDQLSEDLLKDYRDRLQTDNELKEMLNFRSGLPVYGRRNEIMDLINDRPVVIIRGNTGLCFFSLCIDSASFDTLTK